MPGVAARWRPPVLIKRGGARKLRTCGLGAVYRGTQFVGFRTAICADGPTLSSLYLRFCLCVLFLKPDTPFPTFTSQDDFRAGTFFIFTCPSFTHSPHPLFDLCVCLTRASTSPNKRNFSARNLFFTQTRKNQHHCTSIPRVHTHTIHLTMRYLLTAGAFAAIANAQTFTLCNPMQKKCANNPAIAQSFESNFKDGEGALKGWQQTAKGAEFTNEGIVFSVKKTGDAPTIQSDGYLHFGYVEVTMKAARGAGIVSSIVLESDDLDEVDWEFIGSDRTHAQMNYFGKGNTTVYDRMIMANVPSIEEVHRYALNWTSDALTWLIDDAPVRTLHYADANGGNNFPQTPCNVRIGIWAGGDSKDQGTRDWAGGKVDYTQAPFDQVVEKVKITNYSPGKEYEWTDKSGSFKSIKVIDGEGVTGGDSKDKPSTTDKPREEGATATSTSGTEEATRSIPAPEETPCDCEVETVTVTGPPPSTETSAVPQPPQTTPPPPETADSPPPPESTTCTESSTESVPPPPATSDSPPPPSSSEVYVFPKMIAFTLY